MEQARTAPGVGGELSAIARLIERSGTPRVGEVWAGDDAAVLAGAGRLLLASDALVEGVHFRRDLSSLADIGWKSLATNISDLAAMGGRPLAAVVAVIGASASDLEGLYDGFAQATERYDCPVVGGDLSDGPLLVISIGILGSPVGDAVVLRSGGRPGDALFVTGPLGGAAAGLRHLLEDRAANGLDVDRHRRPIPRLAEGQAAASAGASAMIDVSDGLGIDLDRLCLASGVGAALDDLPLYAGASLEEGLGGGDDYELLFSAADGELVAETFERAGLSSPIEIGRLVADASVRTLRGEAMPPSGYAHVLEN